ncbi:MAG: PhoU domain-containing protein [Nitrososphaerota archaeon]|nr:AbrB/MazE/SpoVT family DNA-binding domain-containing protein [Aigarchaeota archaeon]MDW8076257.1 PhoU domain-containing protein [Nitrososphaerota archaeon]
MPSHKRVLQLTGGGSYAITLPKSWVKRLDIVEGTTLNVEVLEDGSLLITPEDRHLTRSTGEIVIEDSPVIVRDIVGSYLMGFSTIKLKSSKPFRSETVNEIRKCVRRLAGAEIIEELPNSIEIQILLDPEAITPDKVLRRMGSLVNSMVSDSFKSVMNGDLNLAEKSLQRDEEVDRHYFTLVRIVRFAIRDPEIARKIGLSQLRLMDFRLVAKFLEDSGDHAALISTEVLKNNGPQLPENLLNTFRQLDDMVTSAGIESIEAFLSEDVSLALKVLDKRSEYSRLYETMFSSLNSAPDNIRNYMTKIFLNVERINENNVDIAELTAPITVKSTQ